MPTTLRTSDPAGLATAIVPTVSPGPDHLSPKAIMLAVASRYRVQLKELQGHSRTRRISQARQPAMFLCRLLCKDIYGRPLSYPQIGLTFGGKHHTTVIRSCRELEYAYRSEATVRDICALIARQLGANVPSGEQWHPLLLPPSLCTPHLLKT